jgi:creatinine amidohydrolase
LLPLADRILLAFVYGDGWSATPFASAILLYTEGQGLPKDRSQAKADEYFKKVVAKVKALVQDALQKWGAAGFK